ncbi:MAG TPA: DUF6263 family protein [Phycisphaerae bacterium]|nr:DUF6263 family protein [Phycisphaerae bacterium]
MPPFRTIVLSALMVGTLGSAVAAADSVRLAPRIDAPTESYVEVSSDSVVKMTGPDGKPMEMSSRSIIGLLQKETKKGDEIAIEATIDRMLGFMAFTKTMQTLYDTDDPDYEEASPMHRDAFTPIMNMPLKFSVDLGPAGPKGRNLNGAEAIRKKLTDLGEQNFVAKTLAEEAFGDRQVLSLFAETPMVLYPNREVKVGESWKKTQRDEIPSVGQVIFTYDCKLDQIEKAKGREVALVRFTGVIEKDADEKPAKDKRLGKIDGTFTGTAKFDVEQGRFVEIQSDTKSKMEVPPWWDKEPTAALMKLDAESKHFYSVTSLSEREQRKTDIARRAEEAKAKREAEEAAAMAGPVEPVSPENEPVAWLQWGGPNRDFNSNATGLANRWPKDGPPKLWEQSLGDGYSALLCDGDTVYSTYSIRDKNDPLKGDEFVVAFDAQTGKRRWEHKYDAPRPKELNNDFGPGPHSTPLIVGDKIYTVSCTAKFLCLDTKTGSEIWSKDLHKEHKAVLQMHGYGSSPVAYKGNILLPVSKEKGSAIMAFNESDGSVAWKGGDFEPGYATLLPLTALGIEQLIAFSGKAVLGLDATNGKTLWSVDHPTQWGANITTPVWCGKSDLLFISSAYGMGSRGVKLEKAGSQIAAKEAWFNPKMKIQHADAICLDDWVFGSSGDFGPAFLACVNVKTGEFGWRQRGIAKANVVHADGKLIVLDEDGTLYLVKADPEKYRLLGKATDVCKKTAWTVPTLCGRTLYLRDREKIVALDLGAPKDKT